MIMKKLFTLLLTGITVVAFAQKNGGNLTAVIRTDIDYAQRVTDTVGIPAPTPSCQPNLTVGLLLDIASNQLSGLNSLGDKEKAQHFRYPGGGTVTGVMTYFGLKKQGAAAGTSNYTVKLYANTATGPGTLLGTSMPVSYNDFDTIHITYFGFSTPVAVTDTFFASVVVDPGGVGPDTAAILMLFDGTNPINSCGNNTAWERQNDNTWHLMNGSFPTEWGVDVEFLIFPIINSSTVGGEEFSPVTTHKVYPNPAADVVNISYSLNTSTDIQINVMDMTGKVVYNTLKPSQYPGAYNHPLDISAYTAGIYSYTIETRDHTISGKLIIQ
jgi:hypothetical protein